MKKAILVIIAFILCLMVVGCQDHDQKEIDQVYIYHSGFGQITPEYKIDLKNKALWAYKSDLMENYQERNRESENEGFTFVCNLESEKIEDFIEKSIRNGFTKWHGFYDNPNICDGHQWGIEITYADQTATEISGSNRYPNTWNKMRKAFEELTGEDILIFDSNWLKEE